MKLKIHEVVVVVLLLLLFLFLLFPLPFGNTVFCNKKAISAHIVCSVLGLLILGANVFAQLTVGRTKNSGHSLKQWHFCSHQIQLKSFLVAQVNRKRKDIIVSSVI